MDNILELFKSFSNECVKIYGQDSIIFESQNIKYTLNIKLANDALQLLNPNESDVNVTHLVNILNSKFNNINDIPDIVEFMSNIFSKTLSLTNFCVICQNPLDSQSLEYIPCNQQSCLYKYEESTFGDIVIEKLQRDPDISMFLIKSAIEAITCNRKNDIFEPYPRYFLKNSTNNNVNIERGTLSKLKKVNYDHLKDFDKLTNIISNFNMDEMINIVPNIKSDQELMNILGKELYILLRFILLSCTVSIKLEQSDEFMGLSNKEMKIYKIDNMFAEESFNKSKLPTKYLFHGSNWSNWYSILRNGLKNCSGTKLMTAGAAHGAGIYLADDANYSFRYGQSGHVSVIGVFEVIKASDYHKGSCIYVVNNENMLMQKYLLIIPTRNSASCNKINEAFGKQIYTEKKEVETFYNAKSIGKIIREYKLIKKLKNKNFRIDVNPDHPFQWSIFIFDFDLNLQISKDMQKLNINEIELEMKFPPNYPFAPPFLRVVKPRFELLTGHITKEGAVCHEILTNKGWVPTCSVESLIQLVISEIGEGNGRLDMKKYNIEYKYEEAKISFAHVCKTHGWS